MKFKTRLAVRISKLINTICLKMGRQGVTWAGKIAKQIDPDILSHLAAQVHKEIIVVCGTNGKTTTNNMLCSFLEAEGNTVICNHTGSNMLNGVISAFVLSANKKGEIDADYACIEIDEASTVRVFPYFQPDKMILTNLFRDQLDRYGEIDITIDLLKQAMDMAPDMSLIINGDDALSYHLALHSGHAFSTYGVSEQVFEEQAGSREVREGRFCRECGHRLDYEYYHFSQLGKFTCHECGFSWEEPKYHATNVSLEQGLAFTVEDRSIKAAYRGFYNIYNILAAYSTARECGYSLDMLSELLASFHPENGRNEVFHIGDTQVLLNLAKNPAGFNQNISAVMEDGTQKDLIVVINDNAQDGSDISWLWDVDFERFANANVNHIIVSGLRRHDMRLRLKYVDINSVVCDTVKEGMNQMIERGSHNLYVLVNYTALFPTRNLLLTMQEEAK